MYIYIYIVEYKDYDIKTYTFILTRPSPNQPTQISGVCLLDANSRCFSWASPVGATI